MGMAHIHIALEVRFSQREQVFHSIWYVFSLNTFDELKLM